MKRLKFSIIMFVLSVAIVFSTMAIAQNINNYHEQDGARWVVGGSADVVSGGEIDIESGGSLKLAGTAITSTATELNLLDGVTATTTELNETAVTVTMADVSTASSVWVVSPHAGTVTKIYTVIDGAIATAPAVLDAQIGGTSITGCNAISIADSGSGAGDVDSCTGTAANAVAAGGAIEIATSGASTNTVVATITVAITR